MKRKTQIGVIKAALLLSGLLTVGGLVAMGTSAWESLRLRSERYVRGQQMDDWQMELLDEDIARNKRNFRLGKKSSLLGSGGLIFFGYLKNRSENIDQESSEFRDFSSHRVGG